MIKETKIYHSATLPSSAQYRIPVISKTYKKEEQQSFVLGDEGKATNSWVCSTELARRYPNFNYVLTFDMTLKCCEGRRHGKVTLYCKQ
jgi:hypothetical protein